jgi:hypothetical protein
MPATRLTLTAALAAAALALPACGDDDSGGGGGEEAAEPAAFAISATEQGKKASLEAPTSVEAGPVEITLTNEGKRGHSAQLVRIDEGHTGQEALQAAGQWAETGKSPLPDWVHLAGGVGTVEGGESATVTVALEPGNYVVADIDTNPPPIAEFEVTGEEAGEPPSADATIEATEYEFSGSGLTAGPTTVAFSNAGEQPHHAQAVAIRGDATINEVEEFFRTEKGRPPLDESKSFGTAVIDGGGTQTLDVELEAGRYAVLCFVPDREGGPPHITKGMISEVEVK